MKEGGIILLVVFIVIFHVTLVAESNGLEFRKVIEIFTG